MHLTIDAGNTNHVFAIYTAGADSHTDPVALWRYKTDVSRTGDEVAAWFLPLCAHAGIAPSDITRVSVSSVVPGCNRAITQFCEGVIGLSPLFVTHETISLSIALEKPAQVGADLLANALAVCKLYRAPAIIIDFGTATTFTALHDDCVYRGGVIAPGINLSLQALQDAAAKLPKIDLAIPDTVIGADTVSAMQSGLYYGYIGMIEGLVTRITAEMGCDPFVIATGGLAGWFEQATDCIHQSDPHLTLKGIRLVGEAKTT